MNYGTACTPPPYVSTRLRVRPSSRLIDSSEEVSRKSLTEPSARNPHFLQSKGRKTNCSHSIPSRLVCLNRGMPTAQLYTQHDPPFGQQEALQGSIPERILRFADVARMKIDQCCRFHRRCCMNPFPGSMPQRLVYVGTNTSQYCYLVYSKNTDLEAESYATLSYCWGKGPHSHSLTKSNMKEYEKCISDIPATLRDAISLVRDMGLHYVWIDALCIVQDDEEDWKIEAGKMAEIYASALFCISALCTTGSDSGLFGNTHRIPSTKKSWEFVSSFESFPLNSRGWTLQERYLSPRLLHIGLSEAWFECRESLVSLTESTGLKCSTRIGATGTFIGLDRFSRLLNDTCLGQLNSAESPIFSSWYDMVMNYCPRQLSKETDRLIALDGLRSLYQPFTNCKYIYGLWEHDIYNGLLWFNGINGHGNISSYSFDPPSMIVFKMNSRCGESSSGMGFGRDPVYLRRSRISSGIISRTLNKSQKIDTDTSFTLDNIRDRTGNVPTWSWASLCGPISFCYINGEDFLFSEA